MPCSASSIATSVRNRRWSHETAGGSSGRIRGTPVDEVVRVCGELSLAVRLAYFEDIEV